MPGVADDPNGMPNGFVGVGATPVWFGADSPPAMPAGFGNSTVGETGGCVTSGCGTRPNGSKPVASPPASAPVGATGVGWGCRTISRWGPQDRSGGAQRRSRGDRGHRRRRRIPGRGAGGQDHHTVEYRRAVRSGPARCQHIAGRAPHDDVERLLFRHAGELNRQRGAGDAITVDDSGPAQSCPFLENCPGRHVLRTEGDPAGVELQLDGLLGLERQCPAEQDGGDGQDPETHNHVQVYDAGGRCARDPSD